ncbi:MAG: tetratricopeptide repeat protein [Novosphingobium sp.]
MICTPRRLGAALLLVLTLGLSISGEANPAQADARIAKARGALAHGDGIAAEMALQQALAAGASRASVAALMGEAWMDQRDLLKAREWLGPAAFAPADTLHGLRMLGQLEVAEGNLPAAAKVLDKALALNPDNADVWVDVAQVRYRGGEQAQAVAAVDHALALNGESVRALLFRGLIVRDQFGLGPSLPWFEAGLLHQPGNAELLGDYAATLGELGRAREMLTVTRHMIQIGVDVPRAFFLQAVLAARAGDFKLSRALMNRTQDRLRDLPAAMLLQAVLDLHAGNANSAMETLDRLMARQPQNEPAGLLLARAMYAAGEQRALVDRFSGLAGKPGASAYLQTLVARALEDLGRRDEAARFLDRAAAVSPADLVPVLETEDIAALSARYRAAPRNADAAIAYVRVLLDSGNLTEAGAVAIRLRNDFPGLAASQALVGDVQYRMGQFGAAAESYGRAAAVRLDDGLMPRLVLALARAGRRDKAAQVTMGYLAAHPGSRVAIRLAADYAASAGDWARARTLLEHLSNTGDACDVRLLSDLAYAQLRSGDAGGAEQTAQGAYRLQPASKIAASAWAMALSARHSQPGLVSALKAKARL